MSDPAMTGDDPRYLGIAPYLYYTDATDAVEWLTRVFGFTEKVRYVDAAGEVFQATLSAGGSDIHLAGVGDDYWPAKGVDGPVGQLNVVYVDDVDAQFERINEAVGDGVEVSRPQDQPYGARLFTVQDVGGNSWTFWQHISDTADLPAGWREIRNGETVSGSADPLTDPDAEPAGEAGGEDTGSGERDGADGAGERPVG
ncbi:MULTISPECIES: VOC family protein [Prauserella salsuginis group]|uniref:VOC family protein n=1 Tax=Prauserella salsuginis TaxID=387889 RepID=A0ABW6G8T0_9PSEU|nr:MULTISPECIES: VOC family protein [Prauserella salsuginis group]MCR3722528.1 putative conserved protein PhnB, glyoxalase superfamily [Prauserella flava]MCR3736970.1 putative conserved protein PhnB, glyoxalase superfamily [Prauserella salsuginis]